MSSKSKKKIRLTGVITVNKLEFDESLEKYPETQTYRKEKDSGNDLLERPVFEAYLNRKGHLSSSDTAFFYYITVNIRSEEDIYKINEIIQKSNEEKKTDIPILKFDGVLKQWKKNKTPFGLKINKVVKRYGPGSEMEFNRDRTGKTKSSEIIPLVENEEFKIITNRSFSETEEYLVMEYYDKILIPERKPALISVSPPSPLSPPGTLRLLNLPSPSNTPRPSNPPNPPRPIYSDFVLIQQGRRRQYDFSDLVNGRVPGSPNDIPQIQGGLNAAVNGRMLNNRFVFNAVVTGNGTIGVQIFRRGRNGRQVGRSLRVILDDPDNWLRFYNINNGFFPTIFQNNQPTFLWHNVDANGNATTPNARLIQYLQSLMSPTPPGSSIDGLPTDFLQKLNNNLLILPGNNLNADFPRQTGNNNYLATAGNNKNNRSQDSGTDKFDDIKIVYNYPNKDEDDKKLINLIQRITVRMIYDAYNTI